MRRGGKEQKEVRKRGEEERDEGWRGREGGMEKRE